MKIFLFVQKIKETQKTNIRNRDRPENNKENHTLPPSHCPTLCLSFPDIPSSFLKDLWSLMNYVLPLIERLCNRLYNRCSSLNSDDHTKINQTIVYFLKTIQGFRYTSCHSVQYLHPSQLIECLGRRETPFFTLPPNKQRSGNNNNKENIILK